MTTERLQPALHLPRLRPDQWRIVSHPAKVKVLAMGRRWGKTVLGGAVGLVTAASGGRVAWIVPTYKNGRPLWRWAEAAVGHLKKAGLVRVNRSERTIEFANGGFLAIYSMDNEDSIRGESFHLVIVDEAAKISETAWTDAIQPTLADTGGDAILISTPRGRNWFWIEFQRGKSDMARGAAEQASFTAPSSDNPSPKIRRAAELARTRVPARTYRQEWLAEFVEDGGGVFRRVDEAATATRQDRAVPGHLYVMGVDWGKSEDYTVLTVVDVTAGEQVLQDRFNQLDYTTTQVGRLMAVYSRFRPALVGVEQNSIGVPLIEQLERKGLPVVPFVTTNASKKEAIDALALLLEQEDLRILDDEVLKAELKSYESTRLPSGLLRYSAPEGLHDDTVVALAIAVYLATGDDTEGEAVIHEERVEISDYGDG